MRNIFGSAAAAALAHSQQPNLAQHGGKLQA